MKEIQNLPDRVFDDNITFRVTTSRHHHYEAYKENQIIHFIRHLRNWHGKPIKRQWDFEELCDVNCRVVKFRINDEESGREEWEVLFTNLPSNEFPIERMKAMYHMRWGIETSFRNLKYSLGAINFHSQKDDFIKMEILAHLIMYNAVSRVVAVAEATKVIDVTLKHLYVINFKMACFVVRRYFHIHCHESPDKMIIEVQAYVYAVRKRRKDVRKIKLKETVPFFTDS